MKFTMPILIADDRVDMNGETFGPNAVRWPVEVPVTLEFLSDKVVGHCRISQEGTVFTGEFDIYEEKLAIHKMAKSVLAHANPCVVGFTQETRKLDSGVTEITKCRIDAITLTMNPNSDERIHRIKSVLGTTFPVDAVEASKEAWDKLIKDPEFSSVTAWPADMSDMVQTKDPEPEKPSKPGKPPRKPKVNKAT